jgi:LPXTG-motif cell wall-anchored protein
LNSDVYADDVFVTSDNRILVSGASDDGSIRPIIMRLNDNATLDNSFATSGTWQSSALTGRMYSVTIQSDGRILTAGQLDAQGTMSVGVVRLANTVTVPTTTIPANQLPATGHDENGLIVAVGFFGIGILLMGMRRRALR